MGQDRRKKPDRREDAAQQSGAAIEAAMQRGEIEVLFQPVFAAASGELIGAEALARWQHPEHVVIGGAELFEMAERAGIVGPLSRHVAKTALAAAACWDPELRMSLNVTAADLADPSFADSLAATIAEAGFACERLTIEITEQVLVANLEVSALQLQQLVERGIRIALDDFGAGFCNFRYLQRLPLQSLKLDASLIEGIDTSSRDLAVLRGILAMASALDLEVIAEGIEREEQLDAIAREGCMAWQGFLRAKPLTAAEFAEFARLQPFPASPPS
ncbi:EAL domain-containing protein [Croceibacterium sp. LX-88]|uniref:EAL domain-containing protein n=1 Tax=Croceibacterium selenioxidans TaxID=2838833 RepID=A0ABS5W2Q6_9SPHN|nr:EAL domain-containing protein [Croceibacterium selenioxidans]MBT2133939.1 EAL domain-containing protein [Croceibacterium selenioxidans]